MRLEKTKMSFKECADAFIVSDMKNIRYLSGFTGDTGKLLLAEDSAYLIVDGRFTEQAGKETDMEVVDYNRSFTDTIKRLLEEHSIKKCAFEAANITYSEYDFMKKHIPEIELVGLENIVENVRMIKDKEEIKLIKKALSIALKTFELIKENITPGLTEKEVANEIEYTMKKLGADGVAFDTIVASGKRSSLPHGVPTDKKIEFGDAVVIDMGAKYKGYCSDITRTIFVGEMTKEQEMIYNIVEKAQKKVIGEMKVGMRCSDAYKMVVDEFAKEQLEKYFIHSLGHGVGLDVHERPYLAGKSSDKFMPGMVVTVEPGIYLPDNFGVRIEDMIMFE